jgi:predicted anti-sigma-YlaC factor YlaD
MLTTGSLFVMYANAFVHGPADMLPFNEWEARAEALDRAERLYMRGHRIFIDALEQRHRGFSAAVGNEDAVRRYLQKFRRRDVPLLYWTVVSGLAAYSINVQNLELNAYIPSWHLMIERAIELDPDFGGETLDEFLVLYFASLPDTLGGSMERAHYHFDRAMEKTGGNSTSALLAYARTVSVREQDFDTFQEYLGRILALDPDDNPATRLMVILDQRKAQWLLDNAEDFF